MRLRCINRVCPLFVDVLDPSLEIHRRLQYTYWLMASSENEFLSSISDPILIQEAIADFVLDPFPQFYFNSPSPTDDSLPVKQRTLNRVRDSDAQADTTSPNKKRKLTNNPVGRRGRLMCTPCRHKHKGLKVRKTLFESF